MTLAGRMLLVRADAGLAVGTGHAMRCLALAETWMERGGGVRFAMAAGMPTLVDRLQASGAEATLLRAPVGGADDARETAALARELGATWIVLDGYCFSRRYQSALARAAGRLLVIDDDGSVSPTAADIVLNQNATATPLLYRHCAAGTRLLLGTGYALLRREFAPYRRWRRDVESVGRRILVTMGGTDPTNAAVTALRGVAGLGRADLEVLVAMGAANPNETSLRAACASLGIGADLRRAVSDMPQRMAWADAAISAAGTTSWELAFMGLPALVLSVADNQRGNAAALHVAGAAHDLGAARDVRPESVTASLRALLDNAGLRHDMRDAGRRLVDGRGADRVIDAMTHAECVRVRRATDADVAWLLELANDPVTRAMSFRTDAIGADQHAAWFARVSHAPDHLVLVVESTADGAPTPVGTVRFDDSDTVSIALAARYRRRGLAVPAIVAALAEHRRTFGPRVVSAWIRAENRASRRAFEGAGFWFDHEAVVAGTNCLVYRHGSGSGGSDARDR